jgi:hypothetical protein
VSTLDGLRKLAQLGELRRARAERPNISDSDDARDDGTAPGRQARPAAERVRDAGGSIVGEDQDCEKHFSA